MNSQHSTRLLITALSLAVAACGVKVNGKSYGLGGGTSSGGGAATPGSSGSGGGGDGDVGGASSPTIASVSTGGDPTDPEARRRARDTACPWQPGLTDPWKGVEGDQPAAFTLIRSKAEPPDIECTAANDHCLRECSWFLTKDTDKVEEAFVTYYEGNGDFHDDWGTPYRAYRTVPATRRMLVPGAIVAVMEYPARVARKVDSLGRGGGYWTVGTLDHVDWKSGKVYLVGGRNPGWLSATRVAVLEYREGGKVAILGGRKRGELTVRKDELFLPIEQGPIVTDPWAEVGADGQPKAVNDTRAFEPAGDACTARNDHCLRPWVWFVDVGATSKLFPGKWDGKAFRGTSTIDDTEVLKYATVAYRTVPATKANLKVGATAIVSQDLEGERDAHGSWWRTVKVTKLHGDGRFDGDYASGSDTWKIDAARIPVIMWMPGDRAEKM